MANLVKDIETCKREILKISGPLGVNMTLKNAEGAITAGQLLSYDTTDGKLVKYVQTDHPAFTVALEGADSSSGDVPVLVATPGTVFNSAKVVGADLGSDFNVVKELWGNGIVLKEVK
ncbi:MAG: hypothetical protein Q4P79_01800 [Fusobacterium sp.]|nr:hypothetical protein [Fusobacterium sp.]MDO5788169.1 hypothetical protein [Fusobacterium sp.]